MKIHLVRPALSRLLPVCLLVGVGTTQEVWRQVHQPMPRHQHAMAYDPVRKYVLLFGGETPGRVGDTFKWDGNSWTKLSPAQSPPARSYHAMAYDAARDRILLFGGYTGSGYYGDTWVWDGTQENWYQLFPASSPTGRYGHAMAYDPLRGRVVLFGGIRGGALQDTWEWNGNNWIGITVSNPPPARYYHSMAFNAASGQVLLFGGTPGTGTFNDTWEWNGKSWTQHSPLQKPPTRHHHAMAYDSARQEVVLCGGWDGTQTLADTWTWKNGNWAQRVGSGPSKRSSHAMVYDAARGHVLLFGGLSTGSWATGEALSDVWAWDGQGWTQKQATGPVGRLGQTMVYDAKRERVVLFGGEVNDGAKAVRYLDDIWEWDGAAWTRQQAKTPWPPARAYHSMTYDSSTGKMLLFGGYRGSNLGDTWEWNGATQTWTQLKPNPSPATRHGHSMTYDAKAGQVLLFGGYTSGAVRDTWVWNGTTWTELKPAAPPPARYYHQVAYDEALKRVVLFGGYKTWSDTWSWDGTAQTWTALSTTIKPTGRYAHSLTYDASLGAVVLFGGYSGRFEADIWVLRGSTWIKHTNQVKPSPGRYFQGVAFDAKRSQLVVFGGRYYLGDTWIYSNPRPATVREFGTGCPPATQPKLELYQGRLPWMGKSFAVKLSSMPTGSFPVWFLGFSDQNWGPIKLPLNLGALGKPACNLYVSIDIPIPLNASVFSFQVPHEASLIDLDFYLQVLGVTFSDPFAGMSNGIHAKIGATKG